MDTNASARAEVAKFQDGDVVKAALGRVSKRLGFDQALSYGKWSSVCFGTCARDGGDS